MAYSASINASYSETFPVRRTTSAADSVAAVSASFLSVVFYSIYPSISAILSFAAASSPSASEINFVRVATVLSWFAVSQSLSDSIWVLI